MCGKSALDGTNTCCLEFLALNVVAPTIHASNAQLHLELEDAIMIGRCCCALRTPLR